MNPTVMLLLIVAAHALFIWSMMRRWQLLRIGRFIDRFDRIPERISAVMRYAFAQEKMNYYQPAGIAHKLILDRKSTRLNSSHSRASRMPSSA